MAAAASALGGRGAKRRTSTALSQFASGSLKHTLWSDRETVRRNYLESSRQTAKACSYKCNVFWLVMVLLFCTPKYIASSDGLQKSIHFPTYREIKHNTHSAIGIPFPDELEAFKALRTFRILTKTTRNEIPRSSQEQNMPISSLRQAIPPNPFSQVGKPLISDKDDAGKKASQASESAKGCPNCEGATILHKELALDSMIPATAARGGAIQTSIQSLNALFDEGAAIDSSQASTKHSDIPPAYETRLPSVEIHPSFLEWGERQLYSPGVMSFTVKNTCNNSFLDVFRIYSSAVQFSCFRLLESRLGPGQSLQIDITFLPRSLGPTDAVLVLETSSGGFLIPVQGFGIASPYMPPQLMIASVEEGNFFKSNLTLYNPYDKMMEVKEIQAWPVDPTNGKLHLLCHDSEAEAEAEAEAEDACGEIERRIKPSCLQGSPDLSNDDCCFFEPKVGHSGCVSSSVGLATYIKLRAIENWKIESRQSSQIAAFEIVLQSNKSWTAQFHVLLATPSSQKSDDIIIIPIEILGQQASNNMSQSESKYKFPDFAMLKHNVETVDAQNAGNGALQLEKVQEELRNANDRASSSKHKNSFAGNTVPSESDGCKELNNELAREVHGGVQGEIEGGVSAHLMLLENGVPIQAITLPSAALKPNVATLKRFSSNPFKNKDRRIHAVSAKNTGSGLLDVYSIQIMNGSTRADGLDVHGPQQFSLKAGQSSALNIYYRLECIAAENDIQVEVITSAGNIRIPILVSSSNNPLYTNFYMELYFSYETLILQISVVALILVLISFSRMLIQEISHGKTSEPISAKDGSKFSTNQKRQLLRFFGLSVPNAAVFDNNTTQAAISHVSGGDQDRRKGSVVSFNSVKTVIAAVSSLAVIMGSAFSYAKSDSEYVTSPPKIPRIRVKSEMESASSLVKSSKERASPTARKGAERKQSSSLSENQVSPRGYIDGQTKLTGSLIRRSSHGHSRSLTSFGEKLSDSPRASSPRDNRSHDLMSNDQLHFSDVGTAADRLEKEKGKGKVTRQSNLGASKQERPKSRGGSSFSASSPASPATTPARASRPVSPLSHSESDSRLSRDKRNLGAFNRTWSKSLKTPQPGSPLQSKHNNNTAHPSHSSAYGSEVEVISSPLASSTTPHASHIQDHALALAIAQNWEPNATETKRQNEIKAATQTQDLPLSMTFEEALRSSITVTNKDMELDSSRESEHVSRKHKPGATLTISATFPRRGRDSGSGLPPVEDKIIEESHPLLANQNVHPSLLAAPLVDCSDRAPGSRLLRSYYQHVLGTLSPLQRNGRFCDGQWLGCDFQENCSCCGRVSVDGSESSSSNPDGDMDQTSSNLEYDIWGNHFADISRHSALQHRFTKSFNQGDRFVESSIDEASSLFSTSSHQMLRKSVKNHVSKSSSAAEFSMFTGKSFAEIPLAESSPKFNLPSAEDVTFASVQNLQPTRYVIPQKRNCW